MELHYKNYQDLCLRSEFCTVLCVFNILNVSPERYSSVCCEYAAKSHPGMTCADVQEVLADIMVDVQKVREMGGTDDD